MFMYMIYLLGTLFRKHYSDIKCFPPGNTTGADTNSHLNGTNPQFRFIVEASKKSSNHMLQSATYQLRKPSNRCEVPCQVGNTESLELLEIDPMQHKLFHRCQ